MGDAKKRADYAVEKTLDLEDSSYSLQRHVAVMALANQALYEILRDRLGISEEEVMYRMAEIDGRDGRKDGKMGARVISCRRCNHKVSTARQRCLYCAELVVEGPLFGKH